MRVIPRSAVVICSESVCEVGARCNWAGADRGNAVHPWRPSLVEAVPVQHCALFGPSDFIHHSDFDPRQILAACLWRSCGATYQSPQLASISGPGNWPLTVIRLCVTPSGA